MSTPGLDLRVAQAGVIAGRDVVHNALESPASPPQPLEPLDRKHTDRVFPSSACEPLDRKHTYRLFL